MVMREALLREHHRGGQSFIVVPRIADMADVEDWLRDQVPEVKFVAAHGQMAAGEVEERMSAFYDKRYDVLLSTTIVESGLDIPSANTIIIHRADRFGLAQLYQLARPRGPVENARLCLSDHTRRPCAYRSGGKAAESAGRSRQSWRWVPAWPAMISIFAARAICSAMNNRAISARSGSSFTRRCWKTRSWPAG